ncbi:2TM domain-containing protein [Galbibacter pacificus]|uniref:2TM domain-containing protein n=1 Tax=Galbibacter pacificus TaxID=2996052 RepID=A0ABT6FT90_9FLAO|nr:2TM domain-containing protein [Galbibacter pacificus]MDG3582397.1 2TM domain-containing protein [Galbibacter pacificus]MDG3586485.1 2TM domain-containing protein [Galbibacter pacificus]
MFSKNKTKELKEIDLDQHELIENAQSRIRQKRRLYYHFVFFLFGSVFMIIINKVLKYGDQYNWFVWGITFWVFILLIHFINVFVTNKFLGKEWEREQREKLIAKQKNRIAKLQQEVEKEFPMEENPKNTL